MNIPSFVLASILWSAGLLSPGIGYAKPPAAIDALAEYENTANNGRSRSEWHVNLPYYEIPLEFIWMEGFESLPKEIQDSLVVVKDGRKMLRWIVHPEDQEVPRILKEFLKLDQNFVVRKLQDLPGAFTASRSLFVTTHDAYFSAKVSTSRLYGEKISGKAFYADEAHWSYAVGDFMKRRLEAISPLRNIILLRDIASFGLKPEAINGRAIANRISMSIRDLSPLATDGFVYVPGFSVLDEKLGKQIASENGSDNPGEYWRNNLSVPLGRALAELYLKFGITLDSPHGQNVLVEMKKVGKKLIPTGRIALRDLMDIRVTRELIGPFWGVPSRAFARNMGVEPEVVVKGKIPVEMWLLGFTPDRNAPSWLSPLEYERWGDEFFEAFEKSLASEGFSLPSAKLSKEQDDSLRFVQRFRKNYALPKNWDKVMLGSVDSCSRLRRGNDAL